ncbi:hypothetical protein C8Q77DRAFT_1155895 [Trametes polyzona]|nr:hypothetical protein C8Q77DRAFT_1155895 [Trametes polyzona]
MSLSSLAAGGKQRRKRSRTTPEQLAKLEEYFAADQSPTSSRRREIARELGLDERQTQIWFQNRRAKVKLQAKMRARAVEILEPPPLEPPPLTSGFDAEVFHLIHEDEEVTIIPCTDLSIGTWRRVASSKHELIAYTCEAKRCINWFVRSGGLSFKMEVPYSTISETRFSNVSPGIGSATFTVERPPIFYIEKMSEVEPTRTWCVSGDWTEDSQASVVFSHCLMGPAYQLSHLVNTISPSGASSEVSLYTPTPSLSDIGSSPEVYSRSFESPVDPSYRPSWRVPRKPSSSGSLRMLHHPSLERLRLTRHASTPLFHSPLSGMSGMSTPISAPQSPQSPADGVSMHASMLPYGNTIGSPQYATAPVGVPGEQPLPRLPLTMPDLPRLHYDYGDQYPTDQQYDHGLPEPPPSAASTPGYYTAISPGWGSPVAPQGGGFTPTDCLPGPQPSQPYMQYPPQGYPGPGYDSGEGAC